MEEDLPAAVRLEHRLRWLEVVVDDLLAAAVPPAVVVPPAVEVAKLLPRGLPWVHFRAALKVLKWWVLRQV